jgi:hypothetical protein
MRPHLRQLVTELGIPLLEQHLEPGRRITSKTCALDRRRSVLGGISAEVPNYP